MLAALSVLAVFSALVDLSDYLEKFGAGEISWSTWVGLIVNLVIIGIGLTLFFKRKK